VATVVNVGYKVFVGLFTCTIIAQLF